MRHLKKMNKRAEKLINELKLIPHPEGGYYRETYCSESKLISPVNGEIRNSLTDIYFLLVSGQVSRFHRVIHDEIWHFYEGDPLELIEIQSDSFGMSKIILGDNAIVKYKHCIKGGNWQAAYSAGEYSLVGCTVFPGFDFSDFEFLKEDADAQTIFLEKNPKLSNLI